MFGSPKELIKKRIPITQWGPKYNLDCLQGDVMAGLTVGLTVIPQGIAYAVVAGVEPTVSYAQNRLKSFIEYNFYMRQ